MQPAGRPISHYEILGKLGEGGMGTVYRARDRQLERVVALKVLPREALADPQRHRRFVQEARAASALNHPNILTVYEIGEFEGEGFIATEYVQGRTLEEAIGGKGLPVAEALRFAVQIADGLSSAHSAGIVHRDIKPANIMLTAEGRIKLLDFGVAKLVERTTPDADAETATMRSAQTEEGAIVGTAAYMSPEQAEGKPVDSRTDIFSFGTVLYQMLTGRPAFSRETRTSTLAAILREEPRSITEVQPRVPAELDRVVQRCLRKDPARRFQSMADLKVALEELREESDTRGRRTVSGWRAGKPRNVVIAAIGVLTAIAVAALALFWFVHRVEPVAPFEHPKITRLTRTGTVPIAAISRDGKYVAYVEEVAGEQSLWLRLVATTSTVRIVAPSRVDYRKLAFSVDGSYVFYVQAPKESVLGTLYQLPILGGVPRKILADVGTIVAGQRSLAPLSVSPDGTRIALLRSTEEKPTEFSLVTVNADGQVERAIATRKQPEFITAVVWSPRGDSIVFSVWNQSALATSWFELPPSGGTERQIGTPQRSFVSDALWLPDGKELFVNMSSGLDAYHIYHLSSDFRTPRILTDTPNTYIGISSTADGKKLASVLSDNLCNLWIGDATGDHGRQVTSGSNRYDGWYGLSWTPDHQIVYESLSSGTRSIWRTNTDGTNAVELAAGAAPTASPNGRHVAYLGVAGTRRGLYRSDADGSHPLQLADADASFPGWSPDSKWVVYTSYATPPFGTTWKVPADGGKPVRLTDRASTRAAVSPDQRWIAYINEEARNNHLEVMRFAGGPPVLRFEMLAGAGGNGPVQWTPDGRGIAYEVDESGVSNIWIQPLDAKRPRRLTHYETGVIYNFSWSRDGKQIALARGGVNNDVVMIESGP